MLKDGLKRIQRHKRDLSFHKTVEKLYGVSGLPTDLPEEFDFDSGLTMPNQNEPDQYFGIPALPYGCTGECQTDICVDEDGILYNPGFTYDNTRFMEGTEGQDVGCDIRDSLKSLTIYGLQGKDGVDPWSRRRGPYMDILTNTGGLDIFDAIRTALWRNYRLTGIKRSASIGTPWFREWDSMHVDSSGIIPEIFTGDPSTLGWHNWKISGVKKINGELYLKAKTWQGKGYGDQGFSYYSRVTINKALSLPATGAFLPGVKLDPKDAVAVGNAIQVIIEQITVYLRRWFAILRPSA